jgi:hypothetical protein
MALIADGTTPTQVLAVDNVFKALRASIRPMDTAGLGQYSTGQFTGILAAATTGEIFQFRWPDATRVCVIRKVTVSAVVSTTFFAAGVPVQIDLIKSTGWSGQGTGGTAIAVAATLKKRSSFGSSLTTSGDIRIATTAALGAGTKTLEANSLAAVAAPGPITASLNGLILPPTDLWESDASDLGHPLVLIQNEGFSVRAVAVPGTGTWTAAVRVDWAEVATF